MKLESPVSLDEIAQLCGAKVIVAPIDHLVSGLNEIHKVEPGDLSFVDHPKYYQQAIRSAATTILANDETLVMPEGKALLYHQDPFAAYNKLTSHFRPARPMNTDLYSQGENVKVGKGTRIGPGVVLGNNVTVGEDCVIGPNVVIMDHTTIGDRCVIKPNSTIGGDAFYYKRRPEGYDRLLSCGRTILMDDVEIGANCTIDRGVSGDTIIGRGTKLDNLVHIGHGVVIGENCLMAAQCVIGGKAILGNNITLWGKVGIQKDIVLGDGTVVLADSNVTKSLPAGGVYSGMPASDNRARLKETAILSRVAKEFSEASSKRD